MAKHILVISQCFYPEPFRINDICQEWVKRGHKVTVVAGIPNYPEGKFYAGYSWFKKRKEIWNGVEIIRIPLIPRGSSFVGLALNYFSFVFSGFFWKTFTKLKPDCVFTFQLSPIFQALVGVWFAKRRKIPHYIYVQDLWPESFEVVTGIQNKAISGPIHKMACYVYKNSKKVLVTSPGFADVMKDRVNEFEKIVYWPQYAEEFYNPREKKATSEIPASETFKIIFTGNIGFAQGLDILPKAAKLLKESGKADVQFVLVGDGRYKDKFVAEIANNDVSDMFIMVNRQPAERIPELLAACDAAFLSLVDDPLLSKTIPAKLQSYMACAMPIVAAVNGEATRIVNEANCGVCCPIGDAEALAEGILAMKTQADLSQLGANARVYFEKHFEKQMLMNKLEKIFLEDTK